MADINPFNPTVPGDTTALEDGAPDYLRAANLHNLGSNDTSWFSDVAGSISRAPEFFTVAALSGLNSFYNTGVQIGNLFGADNQENDTSAWISNIDSDLGQYYTENQKSADTMGFLLTSLVPGTAGIKILNAGQKALGAARTGLVGTNLGFTLGLRTPQIDSYILQAAGDIAKGQSLFNGLQSAAVKALSTGVYQNVLEGVAFETAIQATMHASPVLADQDVSDIAWNVATGGLFQGVLGGAFHAASTIGKINKLATEIGAPIRSAGSRALLQETNNTGMEVSFLARDFKSDVVVDPTANTAGQQLDAIKHRQNQILLDMREKTADLVKGDQGILANMVSDINEGQLKDYRIVNSADQVMNRMADTQEITSVNGATKIESEMAKDASLNAEPDTALQVHYWGLTGERAGTVLNEKPPVVSLADTLAETGTSTLRQKVLAKVKTYGFKQADNWDATSALLVSLIGTHEAEARYIWADGLTAIKEGTQVGQYDIPVLQKALKLGQLDLTVVNAEGNLVRPTFQSRGDMQAWIQQQQKLVASSLQRKALKLGTPFGAGTDLQDAQNWLNTKISRIANIKESALEGVDTRPAQTGDFQAWESGKDDYAQRLKNQRLAQVKGEEADPRFMPTWAKVTKNVVNRTLPDGNEITAMAYFSAMQKQAAESVQRVVAKNLGEFQDQLPEITKTDLSEGLDPRGTGAGFLTYSNPKQGGLGSKVSLVGSVTQRASIAAKKDFQESVEGATAALARNNGAVVEWGGLHQKTSRSAHQWVPMEVAPAEDAAEGTTNMRGIFSTDFIKSLGDEPASAEAFRDFVESNGGDHFIPVEHDETWDLVQAHTKQENKYAMQGNELATSVGKQQTKQLDIFRPIPPNPQDYKHFVFVKDPQVTGQGHTSMIFAQTPERLKQLVDKAREARPELDFFSKADTEDFYYARGTYDYDRTLSENYIDSGLKNAGVYSDYFLKTDPQAVIDDFNNYHSRKIDTQTRDLVRAKYQPQFDWLEQQARQYGNLDTSKFGGNISKLEATAKNPYLSYIKTALNLSRANENPLWNSVNMAADTAVSKVVDRIQNIWRDVKGTPDTPEWQYGVDNINRTLQRYGLNTGYMDAATQLIVNEKIPQGALSKFVSGANAVLSKLVLGLDPLNAITNALGANVLRMTELTNALRQAKSGEGVFSNATVDITGKGDNVFSAGKMTAAAYKAYFSGLFGTGADAAKEAANIDLFKRLGLIKDSGTQFKDAIDSLTLTGQEVAPSELMAKLQAAKSKVDQLVSIGETATGNRHFEELNRFTSAWTAKNLTDPLVKSGDMTQAEQYAYMNTLVNRVEGNTIASQRPFIFQGPIGQAIGLFQSYQFNLLQQMFRYVSEGSRKDAAMLLGLQGTFFGMQGLPAFQAINQHVIGTASGNSRHVDAYDATYGVAGKNIGDLLLYGLPSNLLQTNIYSRGDINPRSVTILPNSLQDVPVINAAMKFFGGIKDATAKIANGGNVWESMLQGVEHSSLSRPLAGLAETLQSTTGNHQVMSTTNAGGIMYTNDLLSVATMSRLAGGRPIDEAIVNDAVQRIHTYQQYDHQNMLNLAGAIKASNIEGQTMDSSQVSQFAQEYTQNGGRLVNFNKFMVNEIKSVHKSAAEKIVTGLQNPFAQRMQTLMGGAESPQSITDVPSN